MPVYSKKNINKNTKFKCKNTIMWGKIEHFSRRFFQGKKIAKNNSTRKNSRKTNLKHVYLQKRTIEQRLILKRIQQREKHVCFCLTNTNWKGGESSKVAVVCWWVIDTYVGLNTFDSICCFGSLLQITGLFCKRALQSGSSLLMADRHICTIKYVYDSICCFDGLPQITGLFCKRALYWQTQTGGGGEAAKWQ